MLALLIDNDFKEPILRGLRLANLPSTSSAFGTCTFD
jgi:hypothetical protein